MSGMPVPEPRRIISIVVFPGFVEFWSQYGKFSITPGCIRKIPLNPPLQKGKGIGVPGLIEMLRNMRASVLYVEGTFLVNILLLISVTSQKIGANPLA